MLNVCSSRTNCPPAGYTSAAEAVCGDDDVFALKRFLLITFYNGIS
jgi:hypothetical protein